MGDSLCDNNGMLLIYVRDKRNLAVYQGHNKPLRMFSNKDIANLHELAIQNNGTGNVTSLNDFQSVHTPPSSSPSSSKDGETAASSSAEVHQADWNWPVIGLTIALALTFLVLFILLCLLLAKCFGFCCSGNRRRKRLSAKYYVNPLMASSGHYKPVEPIYVVTPGSEAAGGIPPPSSTSIYGTVSNGHPHPHHHLQHHPIPPPLIPAHHHHPPFGPSPPIPPPHLIHQQYSRSMTPTSTYRINRRGGGEGGDSRGIRTSSLIQSSMQSTPEANKRDKIVSRTMTVPVTITNNKNGFHQQQRIMEEQQQIEKDQILPHPLPHQQPTTSSSSPPPLPPPHHPSQTPILPFLDPWRKQEVQTREQFIG
uniref:Uncharacterized protein n=2 Tax=Meloidogyne enterolobii TaxID=390850 RepID=A0A6V7TKT7_MELEN|nr:unnamed protein product [Meloidogyne enterolobii]